MRSLRQSVAQFRASALARNAGWILVGQGLSLVCQGIYFIVLARLLGNTEYGIYAGAAAMVSIFSQYSPLGSQFVLIRYVSQDHSSLPKYWGNSLAITAVLGSCFVLLLTLVGPHVAHSFSAIILFCLAVADCLCAQIVDIASRIFQAFENLKAAAFLGLFVNFWRAALAGAMLWRAHHGSAQEWAIAVMLVSMSAAVVACGLTVRCYGRPSVFIPKLQSQIGEGLVFAVSSSTMNINDNIDKTLLGHFGMNAANGIYSVAYRIVDICSIPITSIHAAAFPRFFRKGNEGLASTSQFAGQIVRRTVPLSLWMAVVMLVVSPLLPELFGHGFAESAVALRWLCLIPFFRCLQLSAGDALTGAGFLKHRVLLQGTGAVLNVTINLYLIPRFGWQGAVGSSLATDGMLAAFSWLLLRGIQRRTLCL